MKEKQAPIKTIKVFEATREKIRLAAPLAKEGHMEFVERLVDREHSRLLKKIKKSA
jgi:hypothetical protein